MKKKFITGLLLMAVTAGGFSTFTSCKDTDEDLYAQLNGEQVSLKKALEELKAQIAQCNCKAEIARLEALINSKPSEDAVRNLIIELTKNLATQETVNALEQRIKALEEKPDQFTPEQVATLITLIQNAEELNGLVGPDGKVANLTKEINELKGVLYGTETEEGLIKTVDGLSAWFEGIGLTVEEFQTYVKQGEFILNNKAAIQNIINIINEDAIAELNKYYKDLEGIDNMYNAIFKDAKLPEGETKWWNYGDVMQKIKDNTKAIAALQEEVDAIFNRINDMVTSLILQATTNPVFGSLNTPFGINTMVLMAYYGHLSTGLEKFPASQVGAECYGNDNIDWSAIAQNFYTVENANLTYLNENGQAKLGSLLFTVNPGTVNNLNLDGFELVNSREDEPVVKLTNVTKDDETVIKFGVGTRAAGNGNGLYRADAVVAPEKLDAIKVNIEAGLKETLINAAKNHTVTDMARMAKAIVNQLQNVCDANALRYTYNAISGKGGETSVQKVYSNYGLAATAFKPLSFAALKDESFRNIPVFKPIEISKDQVNLNLGKFEVNGNEFEFNFNFGQPEFNPMGELIIKTTATFTDKDGKVYTGELEYDATKEAQKIQDQMVEAIEKWLGTGENSLDARADKAMWLALFNDPNAVNPRYPYDPSLPVGVVADVVAQANDMVGKLQDKLNNLVDQINSDYLNGVNRLINRYNSVAKRINNVLSHPNHYLQAAMFYNNGDENKLGILSTSKSQPSQFKGNGEAISLWATTYNFDLLAPSFKKIVGVVKVTDQNGNERTDLRDAANKTMAKVMDGHANRVALDVKGATNGVYTYEIAYQALDFAGFTSTVKCYLQVSRN